MKFPKDWYLPGEELIKKKGASAVFNHSDAGLGKIMPDRYTVIAGLKGKDAVGGMLYLTNFRLLFRSHFLNRLRGTFSVFLPSIKNIEDTSFGANRNITIGTDVMDLTYIVWGIPAFMDVINETTQSSKTIAFENSLNKALDAPRLDVSSNEFLTKINAWLTEDADEKLQTFRKGVRP